jgi:hypothetical protein
MIFHLTMLNTMRAAGIRSLIALLFIYPVIDGAAQNGPGDRKLWLQHLDQIARPVLSNLAVDALKKNMPVELPPNTDDSANRKSVSYLEAFGRTLSGIAPWLNLEGGSKAEVELRDQYRQWVLKAVGHAVDPRSKDYMKWEGGQPLVDASFVALGLIRCPWIWQHLDSTVKKEVITAFRTTRSTVPVYSNWILFSAMIETFFCKYGQVYDPVRVEFAMREFADHWYVGDGFFSDGMNFHMDYYNSIVIHPFLAGIMDVMNGVKKDYRWWAPKLLKINQRYAEIQERNINTDGTYPVVGRSIVYRGGVFHELADISLRKRLPESLKPGQVRSALTAVIAKTLDAPGTFDPSGWLRIGLFGGQPAISDRYITTGSLYICSNVFLPLGLPDSDDFWTAPGEPWTAVKAWSGRNIPADHSVDLR